MEKLIEFLLCGYEGKECDPYELTSPIESQKLLLLINRKPRDVNSISKELGLPIEKVIEHISKLERCNLLRKEDNHYRPSFAIFTRRDQEILHPLINKLAQRIAEVIKGFIDTVHNVVKNLTIVKRGLKFPELDYIVIGALALDYEALDVLAKEGLLIKMKKMPGGGEYIFTGFEIGSTDLRMKWMWGHYSTFGKYLFSTHGRLPLKGFRRLAFPDIAWLWYSQGMTLNMIIQKMTELGNILASLMDKDLRFKELKEQVRIDEMTLIFDLSLLYALKYVKVINKDLWRINIPMFKSNEYESLRFLARSLSRSIASELKKYFNEVKSYYEKTTPARNGIPLEEAFNPIYHIVFDRTLNALIESNIIHIPPQRPDGANYATYVAVLEQ